MIVNIFCFLVCFWFGLGNSFVFAKAISNLLELVMTGELIGTVQLSLLSALHRDT